MLKISACCTHTLAWCLGDQRVAISAFTCPLRHRPSAERRARAITMARPGPAPTRLRPSNRVHSTACPAM
ncbi:hypothetical protein CFP75_24410 [Amycolatopsis alba DSM 44262]|uniref:Uncharacterized protein n=1 Tax=Amycolatopsis alba DSM 44262 TaxID=1125972 RepID=A0A229RL41_AMYAL|nr:hypothetical protein CFP75_24410 [Amycolatopsis alba DSM 44262]